MNLSKKLEIVKDYHSLEDRIELILMSEESTRREKEILLYVYCKVGDAVINEISNQGLLAGLIAKGLLIEVFRYGQPKVLAVTKRGYLLIRLFDSIDTPTL